MPQQWMLNELDHGNVNNPKGLTYLDVKAIIERKLAHNKRGLLTMTEVTEAVGDFKNIRCEEDLDSAVVEREIRRMNARLLRCDNEAVGSMAVKKKRGRIRAIFGQLNNMSTKVVREVKCKSLKHIERRYDTDIHLYDEHGINRKNLLRMSNLDSWMKDGGKSRCVMAYNEHDEEYTGVYQPGGTAVRVTGAMTQYVRKTAVDSRKLGRYCSVVMWANPAKKCRFVSIYNICKGNPKGLRTQNQQIRQYMQRKGIHGVSPRDLFDMDFLKQCKVWIKNGEELCVI